MNDVEETHYRTSSLSASGLVKTGQGRFGGVQVTTSTSGSIKLWDNTAASGSVVIDTFTVYPGDTYWWPSEFTNGLYLTITGTVTVTVFFI